MKDLSRLIQISNADMNQALGCAKTQKNCKTIAQFKFLETLKYKSRENG